MSELETTEDRDPDTGPSVLESPPTMDMVLALENAASLAPRFASALRTLMVQVTYPSDWHIQGDTACLSAPGAERIAQAVGGFSWEQQSEPSRASLGLADGYMWTYSMSVTWRGRTVHSEGHASTRDKFLGFTRAGGYRDPADINEADIKRWARHVAIGEGIKQLLGLRALPASELPNFAGGRKPATVKRAQKLDEGDDDQQMRKSITDMLLAMCDGDQDAAVARLVDVTTFTVTSGKNEGQIIVGVSKTSSLRGPRLKVTFDKVKRAYDEAAGGGA